MIKEYLTILKYLKARRRIVKKEMKDVKPAKDLKTFFANLDKKQAG